MTSRITIVFCAAVLMDGLAYPQASGTISGVVHDQTGKPLSAIWVTAVRNGLPPASATTASNATGGFTLQQLPPGTYRICAQSPNGTYLDPCWWTDSQSAPGLSTTIQPGQTAGANLILQSAAAIQVRINDPQALLSAHPERTVTAGVMTKARVFMPASVKSKDATGMTLQVPVQPGQPAKLLVSGVQVALTDATGAAVPAGGKTISLATPPSSPVTFAVSGLPQIGK
jgi:hypothetical protein